jgi:hypothetical protein
MTSTTTNIYELPCIIANNKIQDSDGALGWSAGKIELPIDASKGVLGALASSLFGQIRVNYISPWNASEGHITMGEKITIDVDLFNDTKDAAI